MKATNAIQSLAYEDIFRSASQELLYSNDEYRSLVPELRRVINESSGVEFDWESESSLRSLGEEELLAVRDSALTHCNEELTRLLEPAVRDVVNAVFGKGTEYPIRVSAQIKRSWDERDLENESRVDSQYANFAFPTRAHQDLVNNGCRSSHTLILYYQLTAPFPGAANMEVADTGPAVGLLGTTDRRGYVNELTEAEQNRLDWYTPDYTPGNIYCMSGMKAHRTGATSEVPRIALNVKIQPQNLDYLSCVYGADLASIAGLARMDRYRRLADLLESLTSLNNGLQFELGVLNFLLGDLEAAERHIESVFVSEKPSRDAVLKLLYGGVLRKVITAENPVDYQSLAVSEESVEELSCAHAIMNTCTS